MTLRRLIDALLHIHDTPARTAAAFALGVFFSFSPFLGFQVAGSFALAFLLRLNRVAVFAGLNANLPWFLVPWYVLTTTVAAAAMGTRLPDDFAGSLQSLFSVSFVSGEFWRRAWSLLGPLAWPFVLGSTLGAAIVGLAAYYAARAFLLRRVSRGQPGAIG